MTRTSRYATKHFFEGQEVIPANWPEVGFNIVLDQDIEGEGITRQAEVTVEELLFANEYAALIHARALSGLSGGVGITEAAEYSIVFYDDEGNQFRSDFLIDFVDGYEFGAFIQNDEDRPSKVWCKLKKANGLSRLEDVIAGGTFGYFVEKGVFDPEEDFFDVNFVVKARFDFLETVLLTIALLQMTKELYEIPEKLADDVAKISAIAATGTFTSVLASILYGFAIALIRIAYIVGVVAAFVNLSIELVRLIFPPQRQHKAAYLSTLIRKPLEFFGYNFESNIEELDQFAFIPGLPRQESNFVDEVLKKIPVTSTGVPSVSDDGFTYRRFIEIWRRTFWASMLVQETSEGETVRFLNNSDPAWFRNGNRDILQNAKQDGRHKFNADEIVRDRFLGFNTDILNDYSRSDFKGTTNEVITEQVTTNNIKNVNIRGVEDIRNPYQIGKRKGGFTAIERLTYGFATTSQAVLNLLGINVDLTSGLESRDNSLVVSGPEHSVPIIVYQPGSTQDGIPEDFKNHLGADVIAEKYHSGKSFATESDDTSDPNYNNQHLIFPPTTVPFYLEDFLNMSENAYFISDKVDAKAQRISWIQAKDEAEVEGWLRKRYTENLQEITIISEK